MTLLAESNNKLWGSKYLLHTYCATFVFQITDLSSHSSTHTWHAWIINKRQPAWQCLFPCRCCLHFFLTIVILICYYYPDLARLKKIFHSRHLGHCKRRGQGTLSCQGLWLQSGQDIFGRQWEIRWKWKHRSVSVGAGGIACASMRRESEQWPCEV